MLKTRLIPLLAVAGLLGCTENEGLAEPERFDHMRYTGSITLDGAPFRGLVFLGVDELRPEEHRLEFVVGGSDNTDVSGSYDVIGLISPEDCDKLWLVVRIDDAAFNYSHYLADGCGEHALDLNLTTNIQITGTATLDGAPFEGQIILAIGSMPPDFARRWVRWTFSNHTGEYDLAVRFDPAFCHDMEIWMAPLTVAASRFEEVPAGCGPPVVNVEAISN